MTAKAKGYPDLPIVVVPHPFETLSEERVLQVADEKMDEIVQALLQQRSDAGGRRES